MACRMQRHAEATAPIQATRDTTVHSLTAASCLAKLAEVAAAGKLAESLSKVQQAKKAETELT